MMTKTSCWDIPTFTPTYPNKHENQDVGISQHIPTSPVRGGCGCWDHPRADEMLGWTEKPIPDPRALADEWAGMFRP